MKSDRGGGVLPDVVRFAPRNEKIVIVLSWQARFSNKKGRGGRWNIAFFSYSEGLGAGRGSIDSKKSRTLAG